MTYLRSKTQTVVIGIPVLLVGGTEIQTLTVTKALLSARYRVVICCYHESIQDVVDQFLAAGAEVKLLHLKRARTLFEFLRLGLKLTKVFRALNADIVHIQYIAPGLIPILSARLAGVATVFATVHIAGSLVYGKKSKLMLRISAKLCSAFVCVSKGVEEFWFGNSILFDKKSIPKNRRHFTIYNAIDSEKMARDVENTAKLKRALNLQDRLVIGIVGRLTLQKGHSILLDAFLEVKQKCPNVVLLIIGDGAEYQALQFKAEQLGLSDAIFWLGSKSQQEVYSYYTVMDIFVMPSLYEGFGLTAIEAMGFGLPVIGSDVTGLSEVIEHEKSGLLVRAGDSDALKTALLRLIQNKGMALEYGAYGRERVKAHFSIQHFEQTMLTMYRHYLIGYKHDAH